MGTYFVFWVFVQQLVAGAHTEIGFIVEVVFARRFFHGDALNFGESFRIVHQEGAIIFSNAHDT